MEETLVHKEGSASLPPPHSSRRNVEKLAEKKQKKPHLRQQTCLSSGALGRPGQAREFAQSVSCLKEQRLTPDRRGPTGQGSNADLHLGQGGKRHAGIIKIKQQRQKAAVWSNGPKTHHGVRHSSLSCIWPLTFWLMA